MAIDYQLQVGPPSASYANGAPTFLRGGDLGEQVMLSGGGDYQEMTRRGYVFTARSGAAAAIPVPATTGVCPTLWNQATSGKLVIIYKINLGVAAVGTPVLSSLVLCQTTGTGDAALAAAPIVTFTNIATICNLIGKPAGRTRFANAAVTFVAIPTVIMDLGHGHWLEGAAATGAQATWEIDMKGLIVIPPGNAVQVCSLAATSTTYWTSIVFAEIPVPPGI